MHFITASVLSLCVATTFAAPSRISRRSTMNGSQKALSDAADHADRLFVDIPLTLSEVYHGEIGVPASSVKFSRTLDLDSDASDVIRVGVDLKSLRGARKDPACDFAFRKERKMDEEYIYGFDPEERLAVFHKKETGLWSVRCECLPSTGASMPENIGEMPEEEQKFKPEDLEEVPVVMEEGEKKGEPKETKEVLEETTEITTEVVTKVTTKVTTEVTRKMSTEDGTEEATEETIEKISELESTSAKKRSIESEADDVEDKSQRGVAVNEFDIEIL
ncbi:uncharacterized protein DFL_008123 [Arthrobotrys flagrans]|uniref:Uncharacterized protein n=1 Tax=Arthrobotrys flagrans TaxID=97331 RepID=A0A436ZMV1_ARTFL|nr:hypothetical protein DFL_008123 [Arthrobotrys flagrans]